MCSIVNFSVPVDRCTFLESGINTVFYVVGGAVINGPFIKVNEDTAIHLETEIRTPFKPDVVISGFFNARISRQIQKLRVE